MKKLILFFFIFFSQNNDAQNDTIAIYYKIGKYQLPNTNRLQIEKKLDDKATYHVQIISSCDYLGSKVI